MAIYPKATRMLIPPAPNDPPIKVRMGILHVDAGGAASLYRLFKSNQSSSGVEAHCHIPYVGPVEQYRDSDYQADANYKANGFAFSVETQGKADGEWTPKQLADIKDIMLWLRDVEGVPLRKVTSWDDPLGGWGYHIQFGAPGMWTPVAKSCPGPKRIKQFNEILVPWMESVNKADELARAKPVPRKWNHFTHITPYYKNNSPYGIRQAAATTKRIDLDFNKSADGVWLNTHWPNLDHDGFRYTEDSFKQGFCRRDQIGKLTGKNVEKVTWAFIKTLKTKDGFVIQSGKAAINLCATLGVDVEIEPKFLVTRELWQHMRSNCENAWGSLWKRHVCAKQLPSFAWRRTLRRAKAEGFTTIRLQVTDPESLPNYIDYFRR